MSEQWRIVVEPRMCPTCGEVHTLAEDLPDLTVGPIEVRISAPVVIHGEPLPPRKAETA